VPANENENPVLKTSAIPAYQHLIIDIWAEKVDTLISHIRMEQENLSLALHFWTLTI
jgi:hypothetical protein